MILLGSLVNLQIVNGEEYRARSEKRLIRQDVTYAPRGNIYDRNGVLLATSGITYDLELFKSKISEDELNNVLLRLIEILEKNHDNYISHFPISFSKMDFTESENAILKFKKDNKIPEEYNAKEVVEFFTNKYNIKDKTIGDTHKLIKMRYEIAINGYSSYKAVTIAQNISKESVFEIEERSFELSRSIYYKASYKAVFDGKYFVARNWLYAVELVKQSMKHEKNLAILIMT